MAMTDNTSKVFFWADLQGKQGGFMQQDEITQRNHQLQCYGNVSDYRQGCNTYRLECALSAGITPSCLMHKRWYQHLFAHRLRRKRMGLNIFGLQPGGSTRYSASLSP